MQTFKILDYSANPRHRTNAEARDLEKIIMIHALDLLYIWMYQPRVRMALRQYLGSLTEDERQIQAERSAKLKQQHGASKT